MLHKFNEVDARAKRFGNDADDKAEENMMLKQRHDQVSN